MSNPKMVMISMKFPPDLLAAVEAAAKAAGVGKSWLIRDVLERAIYTPEEVARRRGVDESTIAALRRGR